VMNDPRLFAVAPIVSSGREGAKSTRPKRWTALRCDTTGRKRRCLEPHCIVQRRTSYEIDIAVQRDQPPATHTGTDLMLSEPNFQELRCGGAAENGVLRGAVRVWRPSHK
jgi:hypothetical protein